MCLDGLKNKWKPIMEDDFEALNIDQKRKRVTLRLTILIMVILVCVVFLYFETYLNKTVKFIGGATLGLILFGSIYRLFGNTFLEMDEYEKEERAIDPPIYIPTSRVVQKYLLFAVLLTIIAVLIVWFSYL